MSVIVTPRVALEREELELVSACGISVSAERVVGEHDAERRVIIALHRD